MIWKQVFLFLIKNRTYFLKKIDKGTVVRYNTRRLENICSDSKGGFIVRRSNVKNKNHRSLALAVIAIALVLFIWYLAGFRSISEVEAKDYAPLHQKYYTSVEVEEGDTLWGIAEDYMTEEYKDKDIFIDEVCEMNHITGNVIRTGTTIMVPYYR